MYPGPVSWTHEGYGIGSNRKNSPNTKILVGRKEEGESLSITRDRQPRLWSTIGQLLILVVKRKPIPNSLCLQLGTVPCYAIWSRFERPFLAATFLLSQPDWNLVHFRYLSFLDPAYIYLFPLASCGRARPVPHRTEILFRKLAAIKTEGESRRNGEFTIHNLASHTEDDFDLIADFLLCQRELECALVHRWYIPI